MSVHGFVSAGFNHEQRTELGEKSDEICPKTWPWHDDSQHICVDLFSWGNMCQPTCLQSTMSAYQEIDNCNGETLHFWGYII